MEASVADGASFSATVWLLDSRTVDEAALAQRASWLSASERERYASFTRPQRRRQFLLGRALLRQVLGARLGVAPTDIQLQERRGNAPLLLTPSDSSPYFSISHSGPWVACAVGEVRLGLDIEMIDASRDVHALAEHGFDRARLEKFQSLESEQRVNGFYRLWSEQEARIKLGLDGGHCHAIEHPELAVVLCSEHAFTQAPALQAATLDLL